MLRSSLVLVTFVALGLVTVAQGAIQRITDFEPNEQSFDSAYTPTPWTVTEDAANPSWNTAAGSNTDFRVTTGGAATGTQKLEFAQDTRMMRYNPVDCYAIAGCNSFNTSDNEFWVSWQTKLGGGTLGSEYQGQFTVFRGVTNVNPIGVAIADPSIAGGNNFVLVNEVGAGVNGSPAHFDTGVSNSSATEWTQIALRVGSNAEADSEIYINGVSAGLVSSLIGGASPVHSGHMNTLRFALGNGAEGAANPTSTVYVDRVILGDNSFDVELGFMIPKLNDFIWNRNDTGSWNSPQSWIPVDVPNGNNVTVTFGNTIGAPATVVTDTAVAVNHIEFTNTTHSYALAGLGSITVATTTVSPLKNPIVDVQGTHEIQVRFGLQDNATLNVDSGSQLEFVNRLNLNGNALIKNGDGTLLINNSFNTGSGTIINTSGQIGGGGTIGGDVDNIGGTISPGNSANPGDAPGQVPEPMTALLFASGLLALGAYRWKRHF